MKLTIERAALLKALGHVQNVVERRNTIPILSNVLLSASRDAVSFSATDLDMEIGGVPLRSGSTTHTAEIEGGLAARQIRRIEYTEHRGPRRSTLETFEHEGTAISIYLMTR